MNGQHLDDLIAQMHMRNKFAYVIRLSSPDCWYFFDVDLTLTPHPVKWTRSLVQAFHFPDEESVEEFALDFITPRNIEILRVDNQRRGK